MYNLVVADDHTLVRQGLRRIIEEGGAYKVVGETGDGAGIIPLIRRLIPDMIILDISLPNLRGIEAIRKIIKINKKIKILILTMHKNEEYVYESLTNGAHGYLLKEDADSELIKAISMIQSDKLYISSSFSSDIIKGLVQRKNHKSVKSQFRILSVREREVLKLLAEGNSSKKIAGQLSISTRTVEHHRLNIMKKLKISNIASLVQYAIKAGLVDLA
ncbi:MAG TPA: response regulator transcription factor [bacterium]